MLTLSARCVSIQWSSMFSSRGFERRVADVFTKFIPYTWTEKYLLIAFGPFAVNTCLVIDLEHGHVRLRNQGLPNVYKC